MATPGSRPGWGWPRPRCGAGRRGGKGAAAAVDDLARQACRGGVGYVWRPERPLRPTFDQSVPQVLRALEELALVALAFTRPDPPHWVGGVTGIDDIQLLGQQQRRDRNRLLRLVDPTGSPTLGLCLRSTSSRVADCWP